MSSRAQRAAEHAWARDRMREWSVPAPFQGPGARKYLRWVRSWDAWTLLQNTPEGPVLHAHVLGTWLTVRAGRLRVRALDDTLEASERAEYQALGKPWPVVVFQGHGLSALWSIGPFSRDLGRRAKQVVDRLTHAWWVQAADRWRASGHAVPQKSLPPFVHAQIRQRHAWQAARRSLIQVVHALPEPLRRVCHALRLFDVTLIQWLQRGPLEPRLAALRQDPVLLPLALLGNCHQGGVLQHAAQAHRLHALEQAIDAQDGAAYLEALVAALNTEVAEEAGPMPTGGFAYDLETWTAAEVQAARGLRVPHSESFARYQGEGFRDRVRAWQALPSDRRPRSAKAWDRMNTWVQHWGMSGPWQAWAEALDSMPADWMDPAWGKAETALDRLRFMHQGPFPRGARDWWHHWALADWSAWAHSRQREQVARWSRQDQAERLPALLAERAPRWARQWQWQLAQAQKGQEVVKKS